MAYPEVDCLLVNLPLGHYQGAPEGLEVHLVPHAAISLLQKKKLGQYPIILEIKITAICLERLITHLLNPDRRDVAHSTGSLLNVVGRQP